VEAHEEIDPPPWRPAQRARTVPAIIGAAQALTRRLEMSTRDHGLDAAEALVLAALRLEPRCPAWLLRQRLGFHRSTLSSILDRLERDGHITRARNSVDGRRFEIDLTRGGRIAADTAATIVSDVEAEIAGYTSHGERVGAVAVFEAAMAITRFESG
jgi:DNA-binding MarR family transcriptional regulator